MAKPNIRVLSILAVVMKKLCLWHRLGYSYHSRNRSTPSFFNKSPISRHHNSPRSQRLHPSSPLNRMLRILHPPLNSFVLICCIAGVKPNLNKISAAQNSAVFTFNTLSWFLRSLDHHGKRRLHHSGWYCVLFPCFLVTMSSNPLPSFFPAPFFSFVSIPFLPCLISFHIVHHHPYPLRHHTCWPQPNPD